MNCVGTWLINCADVAVDAGSMWCDRDPTYPISAAIPNGNCRCTSAENWFTSPDVRFWSTNVNVLPIAVSGAAVFPAGCTIPAGNGLLSELGGVWFPLLLAT